MRFREDNEKLVVTVPAVEHRMLISRRELYPMYRRSASERYIISFYQLSKPGYYGGTFARYERIQDKDDFSFEICADFSDKNMFPLELDIREWRDSGEANGYSRSYPWSKVRVELDLEHDF
ncbi:MAG: hypothetical protein HY518_00640 [Candidatus Aenigmarchaeota archaeon]|nr:hypothetical protein [Candidatus Aenigmarchaeota archaeon]